MEMLEELAGTMVLGALLERLRERCGEVTLVDHWKQGEFHHDVVIRVHEPRDLPGPVLVVATNCNGGVKEVLCFSEVPERWALWKHRCPDNPEFESSGDKWLEHISKLAPVDPPSGWVRWRVREPRNVSYFRA